MSTSTWLRPAWCAAVTLSLCAGTVPPMPGMRRPLEQEKPVQRVRTAEAARPIQPTVDIPVERVSPFQALKARAFQRQEAPSAERAIAGTFPLATLKTMSNVDLVNTIAGITWKQIPDLWTYGPDAVDFFGNASRVQALIDGMQARGSQFSAQDTKGIETFCEVLRCGFYQGYYHPDTLNHLSLATTKAKVFPAIKAVQANGAFALGTVAQDSLVASMGLLVSNVGCDPGVVNGFAKIVKQVADNFTTFGASFDKGTAVNNILNGVDYTLTWGVLNGGDNVTGTAFHKTIDPYLEQVFRLAAFPTYLPDSGWLIDAAVWYAGYDGRFHSVTNKGLQVITDTLNRFGRAPWTYTSAQAAEIIVQKYAGRDYYGGSLDWTTVQQQIRDQYTGVRRDFDNGLYKTQVGPNVDPTKVKTLVWANKEVKAQFFRAVRNDTPVDPTQHSDDALTVVVYDTPAAYKMNRFAYDMTTDNGGIYIEGDGTFYTYERTPEDSIYSLEELFRHEGAHYLQGRYLEPGGFGASPLYDNDRLTWLDEGAAEFFAGATRASGIQTRQSKAQALASYSASSWWTPYQVVRATYNSGWTFYDYAYGFVDYLYRNSWDTFMAMADRLKANDATGFSTLATAAGNNATFTSGYKAYLQTVTANANSYPVPSTSPDYLLAHPSKPASEVYADITTTAGLTGVTTSTTTCADWNTFTLRGSYSAGASKGTSFADWKAMDAQANTWLNTLSAKAWSGYKTLTCYFQNYQKDASSRVTWQVVFHGVLNDGGTPTPVIAHAGGPYTGTTGQAVAFSAAASSGPITSYAWTFGEGGTATVANPSYTYRTAGQYTATLTVQDAAGRSSSSQAQVTITDAVVAPAIVTQPAPVTVTVGQTAAFSVAATGSSLTYQWMRNGQAIAGATASTYSFVTKATDTNATFSVRVANSAGSVTSGAALLTVNPVPVNTVRATITAPTANVTVAHNGSVAFTGTATSSSATATLTYAWDFGDGTTASGPSVSKVFTNTGAAAITRTVTLTATDSTGAWGTATRQVTVSPATTGGLSLNLQVTASAGSATFNPNATGATSVTYWVDSLNPVTRTAAPFTHTVAGLASGTHSVYARATDAAGNSKDSGWVNFTVQGLSVKPTVTVSGRSATINPNATGATKVSIWIDNKAAVNVTTAPFTHTVTNLTVGTHSVLVRAYDAAGSYKDSSWVSFTIK